jgi:parallel beta-helix repeat protein
MLRLTICGLTALFAIAAAAPAQAADLTFTYGGDTPWFSQTAITHDGIDAYQSGAVSNNQSSWMEATVTGPGAVRFWWKLSGDNLDFAIDGVRQYFMSGEFSWEAKAFTVPAGSHTLRWTYDRQMFAPSGANAGWVDQISFESGRNLDITPPVTNAFSATGTNSSNRSVTLSCSDNIGCSETFYCSGNECSPATPYSGPIVVSSATNLRFYSTDAAGNIEPVKTAADFFDTIPPSTYNLLSSGTYEGVHDVTLFCGDSGMGCDKTYYCLGKDCSPVTTYSSPITITTSTDLRYYSIDRAGNSEAVKTNTYTIIPDTTPPNTSVSLSAGTYYGARDVSLNCYDSNNMGCDKTYYCLGAGCTPATPYSSAIDLTVSNALRYYSTDRAGNNEAIKTSNYTITPDTTSPTTTSWSPSGTYGAMYTYLSCSDGNGSGCAATYYCLGAGCTPTTAYSSSVYISASTDVRFYSQDKSGNNETVQTVSYVIDTTPPVTAATPPGGSYETAPLVTLACSDGSGTGCSTTYYCLGDNCTPNNQYTTPIAINGTTVLRFHSRDYAYNDETIVSQSYINPSQPKTINVPAMQATIQTAIDIAYNGDTVLVAPGTYLENINFKGKAITVVSSGGADVTVIDGNQAGSVVSFGSNETLTSVLDGFTIKNGSPRNGDGGGIYIYNASPTIRNNRVTANTGDWGGGIYVGFSSPIIRDNVISSNHSNYYGGGIEIGGAASAQIVNNTIVGNSSGSGGGISMWAAGTPLIKGNVVINNVSTSDGGGISIYNQSSSLIIQNVIANNKAATGGGIYSGNSTDSFINNTIANNDSTQGSAIYNPGSSFINNIIAGKSGQPAVYCDYYSTLNFKSNIVYSASSQTYTGSCTDQNGINGNITADPRLSNPQLGYYGLQPGSPAIDAGDGTAPSLPATDLGGMARIFDGNGDGTATVDIGAYEFDPARPVATLQGVPTDFLTASSLTITVGGTDVVSYRYALDGGAFTSTDTAVSTPISLTGLANGQHGIVVLGKNALGIEPLLSSATATTWVVNTETTDLTFTNGGAAPWSVQPLVSRDGIAYQSGAITSNQSSWMETTVTGPGAIRFWWKTSPQWYSNSLSFNIDGIDQTSIIGETDWQNRAFSIPAGSHTLRWTYADNSYSSSGTGTGWIDQITYEPGSSIDVTPPATSATPAAGMYGSSQSVALACEDSSGSGCSQTFYCLGSNCQPNTPYSSAITVSTATSLRFYSTDVSGNSENVKTANYSFDTTPPSTYNYLSAGTYSGMRNVELYCSDSGMGCNGTFYCLGSGCTPTTPYTSAIAISTSSDLRYYSIDQGGNSEAVKTSSYTITPDVTGPNTTANYPSGTYSPKSAYLYCDDGAGSGCASTYYCLGAGCSPTTLFSNSIDISASTDLRFYSVDKSGNSGAIATASYTIDKDSPTTTPSVNGGIYTTSQNVALSCSDGMGSGCSTTYYCFGKECYPSTQYTGPINISSSTYLNYYSQDAVYNREATKTGRYTILTTTPATINVPADRATIQAAIDAAHDGDTVMVAPGTYVENINFKGKAITVASSGGPDSTIIDGNHSGSVVTFATDEWRSTVITGFTIRNGKAYSGGGIAISSASPTIFGNKIYNNRADGNGGGIAMTDRDEPEIIQNVIAGNHAVNGGGIYWNGFSGFVLENNTIIANDATSGGGIFAGGYGTAKAVFSNNVVTAKAGQAAIYCGSYYDNLSPQLTNNIIFTPGGGAYSGICTDQNGFNGNITADPLLNSTAFGYYGLQPGSPAIDSGDNSAPSLPATDLNGSPRLIDGSGQGSARVDIGAYEFDTEAPRAVVSGSPATVTRETSASITVAGQGIVSYRYAVDGGAFTTTGTPVATPITLTGLAGGTHAVAVIGKSSSREQFVSSATVAEWTIDTTAPVTTATPDGGFFSAPQSITLACNDSSGSGCAATFYCLGGGCTPSIPYTEPIAISATTGLRYYSRDAFENQEEIKTASYTFTGTISGRATDSSGEGVPGVYVTAYSNATGSTLGYGYTDSTGAYQITGLTSGACKLRFSAGNYIEQWYSGTADRSTATTVTISAPGATTDINVIMVKGGSITGSVTAKDTGSVIQSVQVEAYNATAGVFINSGYSDNTGAYSISGLMAGEYKLRFYQSNSTYLSQWYSDKANLVSATSVTVTNANTTGGINVSLQKAGSITGTVTDRASGAVLQSVYVTAVDTGTGNWITSGNTNSSGVYALTGLSGSYKLRFSASGYVEQWYGGTTDQTAATSVTVNAPGTTTGINMAMVKGASITGTVTDRASGTGLSSAYVLAYNATTGSAISSGYTDSLGGYTITGLATGSYKIRFTASGYAEQWSGGTASLTTATSVAATAPDMTSNINMGLTKGAVITGTVTDKDTGAAIPWLDITAYDAVTGSSVSYANTDSSGVYRISGLASGNYKLKFQSYSNSGYLVQWYGNKNRMSAATPTDVVAPNTVSGINAAMEKGAAITGTVTDKDTGDAIYGVSVYAYDAATTSWAGSGYTDSYGNYSIHELATGNYKLSFSATGYVAQWSGATADQASASAVAATAPNTAAAANMVLGKAGSISGAITDRKTGAGLAGVKLYLYDHSTGNWAGFGQTDSYGKYSISGLASGSYRLNIDPASGSGYLAGWYGGQESYLCTVTVAVTAPHATTGIDADLVMGGSISGRVTDTAAGLGIAEASITLTNINTQRSIYPSNTIVDSSGAYTVSGIPSGDYSLMFGAPGYINTTSPATVTVSAPAAISGVDTSLTPGGGISGRITDSATGEGILEVAIEAVNASSGTWFSAFTNDNGDYTITGLPDGSYALYVDGRYAGSGYGTGWYAPQSTTSKTTAKRVASTITSSSGVSASTISAIYSLNTTSGTYAIGAPSINITGASSSASSLVAHIFPFSLSRPVPASYPVTVAAPATTTGIIISIARMGTISGTVTDSATDEPLSSVSVTAYDSITGIEAGNAYTNSNGTYTITGLPSGSYRIQFTSSTSLNGGYLDTWYGNEAASTVTAEVTVAAPETTVGINAQLAKAGGISGSLSANSCPGPQTVNIMAYDAESGKLIKQTWAYANYSNNFTISGLPTGSYKLAITPVESGYMRQWYPGKTEATSAEPVTVTTGSIASGIKIALAAGGGSISGKVSGNTNCTLLPGPVKLYDWYSGGLVAESKTSADGSYQLAGLPDASYKLLFSVNNLGHWYSASGDAAQASQVVLSGGSALTGIDLSQSCGADGDLNGSGNVNLTDARKALRIAVGLDTATPEFLAHGDLAPVINGVSAPDGAIDIADALLILQKVVSAP